MNRIKINSAPQSKIPFENVLTLLEEDKLISKESVHLSRTLISPEMVKTMGTIGALGSKKWVGTDKNKSILDTEYLTNWFAKKCNLKVHAINAVQIDSNAATTMMSQKEAARLLALVVNSGSRSIQVACAEPFDTEVDQLLSMHNKDIDKLYVNSDDLKSLIGEIYSFSDSVSSASTYIDLPNNEIQNLEQLLHLGAKQPSGEDQSIVSIVDWLLQFAISIKASDIHIEPHRNNCEIRYRIDGKMNSIYKIPAHIAPAVTGRIKILSRMDVAEKRRPQDGRIKTVTKNKMEIEFRVSAMPTAFGEKIVMRVFDPEVLKVKMEDIGFSKSEIVRYKQIISHENGIVLITGPTGSGKTTTLYTTLKYLATNEVNVCTIEDPIELIDDSFNQLQVHKAIHLNFADGIRTLLRQDPDIIMVGEIRDHETAETAAQAALTGHLVLSTLHTNDSATAITRLKDLKLPNYLITDTLRGVVAMRLVRRLCENCKKPSVIENKKLWDNFCHPYKLPIPKQMYDPVGCKQCRNQGFLGRIALFEILTVDENIKTSINNNDELKKIRALAVGTGMKPLRIAGAREISNGITTMSEVALSTPSLSH